MEIEIKHIVTAAIIIVCISIAYYFVIALPNQNAAKIELEKQKIEMEKQKVELEQAEKQKEKELKAERTIDLLKCRAGVVADGNEYLKLNGTPVSGKPGVFRAPKYVHDEISKKMQNGFNECQRMFGDPH